MVHYLLTNGGGHLLNTKQRQGKASLWAAVYYGPYDSVVKLLLLFPDQALKSASDTINQTVVDFAVRSFQTGAKKNFAKFLAKRG